MSFLGNYIIPFIYKYLVSQECLTPLRVLDLYFYSVTVFSVRGTISHMAVDLFQHTHTLSENKGMNSE